MKRLIAPAVFAQLFSAFSFFLLPPQSAAQSTPATQAQRSRGNKKGSVGNFFRAIVPQIAISSPALQHVTGMNGSLSVGGNGFSAQIERYNAVFRNGAKNAVAHVVVYQREVAVLKPGQIAVDNRKTQTHWEQIPAMVFYFAEDQPNKFLGMAWGKINFYPGWPQSQSLLFNNVISPDGSRVQLAEKEQGTLSPAELGESVVHMKRKWLGGTNGLQVANASEYLVRVSYNGRVYAILRPGSIGDRFIYLEKVVVLGWGINSVQVDYFEEAAGGQYRLVKSLYDVSLGLSSWGIYGRQLIIGDPGIGYIANY